MASVCSLTSIPVDAFVPSSPCLWLELLSPAPLRGLKSILFLQSSMWWPVSSMAPDDPHLLGPTPFEVPVHTWVPSRKL